MLARNSEYISNVVPPHMRLGCFVETVAAGEGVRAFVPPPLPPNPLIDILGLLNRLGGAERALGRLDGITVLPSRQELLLYMYVRKEAVLSSQFESAQSTLTDLLRLETEAQAGQPVDRQLPEPPASTTPTPTLLCRRSA